jgi:hypothetical protein
MTLNSESKELFCNRQIRNEKVKPKRRKRRGKNTEKEAAAAFAAELNAS